jgi:hypothetical protein
VEATLRRRSNFLQLLRLVGTCSSASEGIAGSGDLDVSDLVRFSSAPSLVSVGAAAGDGFGRYACQLKEKLGWILFPTSFGGFIPLVSSSSGVLEILVEMWWLVAI